MEEPKISQIEKLIEHFRDTEREDELYEVLKEAGISSDPTEVVDPETHEFSEQAYVFNKKSEKSGLRIPLTERAKKYKKHLQKWYVRYGLYYLGIFLAVFFVLNAPIFFARGTTVDNSKSQIVTVSEIQNAKMDISAPIVPGEIISAQNEIVIPKINVTAPIIFVTTQNEKTIQNNLTKGVVHYDGTAFPGEIGNVFITGHSSNFWWIKGSYNYVFANLDKLKVGDQAKIYYNGNKFVYQVKGKKIVNPSDISVLEPTSTPTLTLMTCTPPGTNWKRLIITFDQVLPKYEKPKVISKQILVTPNALPSTDSNTGSLLLKLWNGIKSLFSLSS